MAFKNLRDFLNFLDKKNELLYIKEEVDPYLEMTEILDRIVKSGGPAVIFEKPKGKHIPVVGNLLGTHQRMKSALGISDYSEIDKRISAFFEMKEPQGLIDKLKMLPKLAEIGNYFPKIAKSAPCQEVILEGDNANLNLLPVITCWPQDGGPYITFPLVYTKDRETGKRNCGIYRMQVYDNKTTGMHWQIHKHGAKHARQHLKAGENIPVAVAIGCDPATVFSGAAPLPDDVDEMLFAGFLRNEPVEMVCCKTVPVEVPAESEIVLEGYVDPAELKMEGPFGDHTGFYSLADDYPVFHITCITHRKNPYYLTTIVGRPPMEDCYMGYAIERITLPIIKKQLPEIEDLHMPFEGVFHNLMLVAIKKQYPGHARKVMHALWGLGQAMLTKVIVVVDEGVNLHDPSEVCWRVLNHIDPKRDFEFAHGPMDVLDHACPLFAYGSKVGIDATRKWKEEGFSRQWPDQIVMTTDVKKRIDEILDKLNIRSGK